MNEDYRLIEKTADMPADTCFCFIMDSALMEPLIYRGEKVFVSRSEAPADMEPGLFLYKGKVYCRQYCEDYAGNLHLLCANPEHEKENLCLNAAEKQKCLCLGKVLGKEKPPRPLYL